MYSEDQLVMISALQHLAFCERQCALIHIEQQWAENRLTVLGEHLHEKVHSGKSESRSDIKVSRSLRLVSYRLGLVGQADVVEFHLDREESRQGIRLEGLAGKWLPFPVEYKKGNPKKYREDDVQLCAQALCLEEQFNVHIPEGALFYGERRRRNFVKFDKLLRDRTEKLAEELHSLIDSGITPPAEYSPKCKNCSLLEICNPKWSSAMKRKGYERILFSCEP